MDDDENNTRYLEVAKIMKDERLEKSCKSIERFAINKDEHCCFGYFKKNDPECNMCEAHNDCYDES